MIVTPFVIQDYAEIELANDLGFENWGLRCGVVPALMAMERSGTFWTLRDDKGILLIGGYYSFFENVCEASFFPSKRFIEKPRHAYRIVKQYLCDWTCQFKRVQLNCRAEERFTRFAKALGFIEEGRLRCFDYQGRDHMMMAIVR